MDTTIDLPPEFTAPPLSHPADGTGPGHGDEHGATGHAADEFVGDAASDGASGGGREGGGGWEGGGPGFPGPTAPPARAPGSASRNPRRQGFLFATTAIVVVAVSAGVILHKPLLATIARLRHETAATGTIALPKAHNSASVLNHPNAGKTPLNTAIPGLSVSPMFSKNPAGSSTTPKSPPTPAPPGQKSSAITAAARNGTPGAIRASETRIVPSPMPGVGTDPGSTTQLARPAVPARAAVTGATPASVKIVPPSPLVGPIPPAGTLQSVPHPVKVATQLIAAPASRTYEVKTMSLVAALARLVAELRSQNAAMQTEISTLRHHVDQEMVAFNQRLTFDQAHDALALAGASDPAAQAKRPLPVHSAQIFPAAAPHVAPVSPASYGIQAASPGLAMLIRHGVTYEVSVGSVVPGVGRVISIVQYGSGWIVRTDHGVIR